MCWDPWIRNGKERRYGDWAQSAKCLFIVDGAEESSNRNIIIYLSHDGCTVRKGWEFYIYLQDTKIEIDEGD